MLSCPALPAWDREKGAEGFLTSEPPSVRQERRDRPIPGAAVPRSLDPKLGEGRAGEGGDARRQIKNTTILPANTEGKSSHGADGVGEARVGSEQRRPQRAYLGVTTVTSLLGCKMQQVVMVKVGGVWGRLLTEWKTETDTKTKG